MNETLQRTQSDSAMAELSLSEKLRLVNDGGAFSFDIEVDISTVEKQEESIRIHIVPRTEEISDVHGPKDDQTDFVEDFIDFFMDSSCTGCKSSRPVKPILKPTSTWVTQGPIDIDSLTDITPCRSVSFKDVEIREFSMTLGDHPSAIGGPPIRLDYDSEKAEKHLDLDKYEQDRQPRRSRRDLKLSLVQRHEILVKERGYTVEEVKGAWKESLEIRQKRMETLAQSSTHRQWEEFTESLLRLYNRLFRCMVWV